MRKLLLVLFMLSARSAFADYVSYSFSGRVYERRELAYFPLYTVKGLPYTEGNLVFGTFSYFSGGLDPSPATLTLTIDGDSFSAPAIAKNFWQGPDGTGMMIKGMFPALNAEAAFGVFGSEFLMCSFSVVPCNVSGGIAPLQRIEALRPFAPTFALEIRNTGAFFAHPGLITNEHYTVFLDALPLSVVAVPEPSTLTLLSLGLLGAGIVRLLAFGKFNRGSGS